MQTSLAIKEVSSGLQAIRPERDLVRLRASLENYRTRKLAVPTKVVIHYLPLREIQYIEADGNYAMIHMTDDRRLYTAKTVKHWESEIDSDVFVRSHSKYLVNGQHITSVNAQHGLIYIDHIELRLSRSRKQSFLDCMNRLINISMT